MLSALSKKNFKNFQKTTEKCLTNHIIYSKNACKFAFLNKIYDLTAGYNVIEISAADILAQIKSNADCYSAAGYFWCQVNGTDVDLYFDEFIGIYPAAPQE